MLRKLIRWIRHARSPKMFDPIELDVPCPRCNEPVSSHAHYIGFEFTPGHLNLVYAVDDIEAAFHCVSEENPLPST